MIIEQAFCLADNKKYTATEYKEFINNKRRNRKAYSDFLVCPYCKKHKFISINSIYRTKNFKIYILCLYRTYYTLVFHYS